MMQLVMAGALFLLAFARVPALARNRKDMVFGAAIFAGTSSLLSSPSVYYFIDMALGGINLAKLAVNSFMIVGLWYLRAAVVHAISPAADRKVWLRRLPLTITLVLQTAFFFLTGPTSTTLTWGNDYHQHLPAALFSLMMIAFIAWSCGEIAWACFEFVPKMRRSFRIGFSMVGFGCLISVLTMALMAMDALSRAFPQLSLFRSAAAAPFHLIETVAILLVGLGLSIPPLAGRISGKRAEARLLETIAKVEPIRERVLLAAAADRVLQADLGARPQDRLHRMIVEIWDAELFVGQGRSTLTEEERSYVLLVESDFGFERTK